ncbi:MAG: hypothetical protein ABS69_07700 [Nitrosomonadales bacterium SCN 54-20]|nr:MAG: hypothetical protein ABS69_07700 [Nitrosomonadales bacterium SCN 54-20]
MFFLSAVISLPAIAGAPENESTYRQVDSRTLIAFHQNDGEGDCQEAISGNNFSLREEAAPTQENTSRKERTGEKSTGLCREDAERQEGLLHRILCFFLAPSPSRPNPDVDTNISAGGAGGG